jgi:hypothetical protein
MKYYIYSYKASVLNSVKSSWRIVEYSSVSQLINSNQVIEYLKNKSHGNERNIMLTNLYVRNYYEGNCLNHFASSIAPVEQITIEIFNEKTNKIYLNCECLKFMRSKYIKKLLEKI